MNKSCEVRTGPFIIVSGHRHHNHYTTVAGEHCVNVFNITHIFEPAQVFTFSTCLLTFLADPSPYAFLEHAEAEVEDVKTQNKVGKNNTDSKIWVILNMLTQHLQATLV